MKARLIIVAVLLCILPIPVLAQTTRSLPQPHQAKVSDLSRNPALVLEWANRVMAHDPKVRATAEAALVQGAGRSLPLLRRFLNRRNEDLHLETLKSSGGSVRRPFRCSLNYFGMNGPPSGAAPLMP